MNKKLKKGIFLGVMISFIAILLVFTSSKDNYVEAEGGQQLAKYSETCDDALADGYYGIDYVVNEEDPHIATITVKGGTLKITEVSSGKDRIETAETSYLGVPITPDAPLSIKITDGGAVDIKIHLVVAVTDEYCMSLDDYVAAEAVKSDASHKTYEIELTINFPNLAEKAYVADIPNPQYNTLCKAIREGTKNVGIPNDIMDLYNSNGMSYYREIADYCFNENVTYEYSNDEVKDMIETAIEGYYIVNVDQGDEEEDEEDPFNKAFKAARQGAEDLGDGHFYKEFSSAVKETKSLSCNPKYAKAKTEDNKDYDISANKTYYYAKKTDSEDVTYNYNYTSGNSTSDTKEDACSRTCEEAVEVEYGPPVATTAGMCFEYRVKVTSRVKCKSKVHIKPPVDSSKNLCQPVPYCNSSLTKKHQGGPSEDFDMCIDLCDGGKYSQKCSKKCYAEVYGNNSKNSNKLALSSFDFGNTLKVSACIGSSCVPDEGKYTMTKNGAIDWVATNGSYSYARYYIKYQKTRTIGEDWNVNGRSWPCANHGSGGSCYLPREHGFKRNYYGKDDKGNDSFCHDPCRWTGCGKYTYLNAEEAKKDYKANLAEYKSAIKKCKASATCTTKTATFTMKTTYNDKSGTSHTITYPSTGTSKLDSKNKGEVTAKDKLKDLKSSSKSYMDTVIYDYDGCYTGPSAKNFYQTVITYPGVWKNNKTQEISYEDKTGQKGWYLDRLKFCLPFDVKDTNTKWWYWYHNEIAKQTGEDFYYYTDENKERCESHSQNETYKAPDIPDNIKASIKKFGYFGWNIDVSCFFAVVSEGSDEDKRCEPYPLNYRVRSVDNSNLFPDPNENVSIGTDYASTGREPGFNWTSSATISSAKATTKDGTANYYVNPELLIAKIQKRGDTIYNNDDKYLDYEFVLTPEILNALRNYNRKYSYTVFNGEFWDSKEQIDKYGLILYKSNLFNFHGVESTDTNGYSNRLGDVGGKYVKAVGNIGCNNDSSGTGCETTASMD